MGTDIEKLVDLMIQERMQSQFAKWREAETGTEKKEVPTARPTYTTA